MHCTPLTLAGALIVHNRTNTIVSIWKSCGETPSILISKGVSVGHGIDLSQRIKLIQHAKTKFTGIHWERLEILLTKISIHLHMDVHQVSASFFPTLLLISLCPRGLPSPAMRQLSITNDWLKDSALVPPQPPIGSIPCPTPLPGAGTDHFLRAAPVFPSSRPPTLSNGYGNQEHPTQDFNQSFLDMWHLPYPL